MSRDSLLRIIEAVEEGQPLLRTRRNETVVVGLLRELHELRQETGRVQCRKCSRSAAPDRTLCERCYERTHQAGKRTRERRKAQGLCIQCNRPAYPGRSQCEEHARSYLKNGGPEELPPAAKHKPWPALSLETAHEWFHRLVNQVLKGERRHIPKREREDFEQDIHEKLLAAGTFEAVCAKGFDPESFRSLIPLAVHRHMLNWLRGYGRGPEHFVPTDPHTFTSRTSYDEVTDTCGLAAVADDRAEERAHARGVLEDFDWEFPEERIAFHNEDVPWYPRLGDHWARKWNSPNGPQVRVRKFFTDRNLPLPKHLF